MPIEVSITQDMINDCHDFASKIILGDSQYDRLPATIDVRIERTFAGKLAELAFHKYLAEQGKDVPLGDMFKIFDEQSKTDLCDFSTKDGKTIDVKSASRTDHYMIMVPIDQFKSIPKDYYVGVRINTGVTKYEEIKIDTIKTATIYGYCEYEYLRKKATKNYLPKQERHKRSKLIEVTGEILEYEEGDCKPAQLERLLDIKRLIKNM
ncbi:hypothetical protein [Paraclostridium bifermentans]|uniref:hypothetical protein n=1 Tax=Paraclostridium bifermentans TaxID=1490 RepID=UPI0011571559|nr:hypothetical protein [Paraclostridium bifermentans]TQO55609.1 hypothetical protein D5S05_17500 [Paraclostridium bifermentans]